MGYRYITLLQTLRHEHTNASNTIFSKNAIVKYFLYVYSVYVHILYVYWS